MVRQCFFNDESTSISFFFSFYKCSDIIFASQFVGVIMFCNKFIEIDKLIIELNVADAFP